VSRPEAKSIDFYFEGDRSFSIRCELCDLVFAQVGIVEAAGLYDEEEVGKRLARMLRAHREDDCFPKDRATARQPAAWLALRGVEPAQVTQPDGTVLDADEYFEERERRSQGRGGYPHTIL
jgi:hypothetical protein